VSQSAGGLFQKDGKTYCKLACQNSEPKKTGPSEYTCVATPLPADCATLTLQAGAKVSQSAGGLFQKDGKTYCKLACQNSEPKKTGPSEYTCVATPLPVDCATLTLQAGDKATLAKSGGGFQKDGAGQVYCVLQCLNSSPTKISATEYTCL
jgi:hypothetical protein